MATKSIYFSLESDEKEELDRTAKSLGIKPSELARRRYRQGMMIGGSGVSSELLEYLIKLSTFQYAALEKIINQRPDNFEPVVTRGAELFSEAMKILKSSSGVED